MPLGVIGIQQGFRRDPLDHLGELPSEVHRVLDPGVEALTTDRGMDVGGVAGQQDPSRAVGRRLPARVREPGDPGEVVDPVIGPVHGDEPLAKIVDGRLAGADLRLGQHDPDRPAWLVDHDAVLDLVLGLAQRVRARGRAANAQLRLLGHLDLGEQGACRGVPTGELDAGFLADQAASSVAPDEIRRPDASAVGQRDVHPGVVLGESGHLGAVLDRDLQLSDPAGEDALDVLLPQPEPVGMPGGEIADVQADHGEPGNLGHLPLGKEPIRDAALIEDLDGA